MSDRDGPVEPVRRVEGTGVPVRGNDIDTDQIIPARYLKAITFDGLGEYAFFDQRFDDEENPIDHPFNQPEYQWASILVVNANFGCGSSREHAPQALQRWGIDAIVGESFAEIFAGNCLAMGIPTVTADADEVMALQDWIEANPGELVVVDVESEELRYDDHVVPADVDDAQREALIEGAWDTTALMRANASTVRETASSLPYVRDAELPEP
jgi:3-isopropylmalate/(R)-2-methylmalate dehydratase small subunit